ncbi:hypothetical protein M408DRAFT_57426, partial [Serendipita vermifera MAFF 305830]
YGKDRPNNAITDIEGDGGDINKNCGGEYVWIVPVTTDAGNAGCTRFDVEIRDSVMDGYDDLAKGAGGDYRYLIPRIDCLNNHKIIEIRLMRSSSSVQHPPEGYSGMSNNINQGRENKGDHLYVVWKTAEFKGKK